MRKKLLALVLGLTMVTGMIAGCGGAGDEKETGGSGKTEEEASTGEKEKIVFWYIHSGDEAEAFEKAIASYNESQDKYVVEGLSVTDKQKIIVAMSGNESPDIVEVSNQDVITYANNGLIESLSTMAEDDNFLVDSIFSKQSVECNTLDGTLYGMPIASMVIAMFYNKDILEEIGYSEPPQTMEELYEMAQKATEVDDKGTITRLGYPLFPLASARQELIYAFGGRWWSKDGKTLTPNDPLILESLNMNMKYREEYDVTKVQEFVATANTNRYTENDMFFTGKQLFRFDGTWLAAMMKNFNSDVNYGVALIPGTQADKGMQGSSRFETTSLVIPVVAKQKEGAWDFTKYISNSEATKDLLIDMANLPAQVELFDDPDILSQPNFDIFIDALKRENGVQYATITDFAKYVSLIEEHLDYVYNGIQTPEEAMGNLAKQAELLQ